MNSSQQEPAEQTIIVSRLIPAPRPLVFQIWTDPLHVVQWWGPQGFTNTNLEMDVRPGRVWRFIMHGPNGVDYPNKIVYEEIIVPERLLYTHGEDQEHDPDAFHVLVTFEEEEGQTRVTMRLLFASVEQCRKMREFGATDGGQSSLQCLEEYLQESAMRGAGK